MAITTNGGAGITADAVATLSNKTLEQPVINNATFTGAQAGLEIKFGNNIVLEGTTDNAFEMTLSGGDPTADRTITLPDVTGTVITTGNLSSITSLGTLTTDIVFEGATDNAFETTLTVTDPTADRTITFPDSTGTVALTGNKLSAFAATTSSELAGVISDETGTGALVFANTPTLVTPILGTPTSGTLTNCTGLPVSGISASTTSSLGVGSVELGHASDTTLARVSAGIVSIEGVNVVTTSSTDTLSNKTLTAPKFADLGFIADANGNELIILDTVTSAVNEVTLANAATGNAPTITASGGDTNIGITLTPKGSGNVTATALVYTQTLNTPTFSTNAYTLALTDQGDILLASNGSTAGTISIPTNANVAFPTGTQITIVQTGSGQITINAVTSGTTTINSTGATATAPKLRAQYSSATCVKTATDTWLVIGDIA